MYDNIKNNIAEVLKKINESLARANRTDKVTLIGATKTQSDELIQFLASNNLLSDVGENHAQEIMKKHAYGANLNWHMIGQLQSNKVKNIIDKVTLIHSLDRLSLAEEINKQSIKNNITMDCLIEVNMGNEIAKGGIEAKELRIFCEQLEQFSNIRLRGLMCVMPHLDDKNNLQDYYKKFYDLYGQMQVVCSARQLIDTLSCGMSEDFELAVEFGHSNMVRVGRKIFGERIAINKQNNQQ